MVLTGEYSSKLGEKNRTALPKEFRDQFSLELMVTRGYEGCLIIVDKKRWQNLVKTIEIRPFLNIDARNTKRFLVGGAREITLDKQGRFVMPEQLKEYAKLSDKLIFVGIQDFVEIWDEDKWNEKIAEIAKNAADIGDRLSDLES
ncbi:division/cell wall cluster transcriptional repressor MraZ [Candidatus Dojkabacteria bacterium]|nr:division/cell wall cluster transcriptional repressor MraZ [Candidatus Dojkabacteria bacterium]